MAVENKYLQWALSAAENLDSLASGTGHIYKAVALDDRKIANNGLEAGGLLTYVGQSGEHVGLAVSGLSKYTAGAAINAGALLTVTTSGYIITATSGSVIVGKNLDSSVGSGAVGTGFFDFSGSASFDASSAYIATYDLTAISAKADLSAAAAVGKAVSVSAGDFAAASKNAQAVLYTGTTSGGTSYGRSFGKVTVKAGDVIAAGESLKVTSGWFLKADSGDVIVGRALAASAAGNSGSTFLAQVNFATPHYATDCFDVMYQ